MNRYRVFKHTSSDSLQAIKVGYSWPAFFFGVFWALFKREWLLALLIGLCVPSICLAALVLGLYLFEGRFDSAKFLGNGVFHLLNIIIGFEANKWLEMRLLKRDYRLISTVDAETNEMAISQSAQSA